MLILLAALGSPRFCTELWLELHAAFEDVTLGSFRHCSGLSRAFFEELFQAAHQAPQGAPGCSMGGFGRHCTGLHKMLRKVLPGSALYPHRCFRGLFQELHQALQGIAWGFQRGCMGLPKVLCRALLGTGWGFPRRSVGFSMVLHPLPKILRGALQVLHGVPYVLHRALPGTGKGSPRHCSGLFRALYLVHQMLPGALEGTAGGPS